MIGLRKAQEISKAQFYSSILEIFSVSFKMPPPPPKKNGSAGENVLKDVDQVKGRIALG